MFSIVAVVAMLATTIPTATLGAASYSDELEGAYDYAYGIGITTQSSIDTANMYGSLIRSHMAKMMVNYAVEVLGQTPDTSLACEFTDIANQSDELRGYIVEACQLGLMGQGITAFNPNGVVTRAQFGTVLSRALYGDMYNVDTTPYYAEHLLALQDAGIMNNISNPNAVEVRGYVMLMMQRGAGADVPAICSTPENVLSCSLGLDTCPAECIDNEPVEVKDGSLNVSLGNSLSDGSQIPYKGIVKFASVDFKASSADVSLKTLELKKVGLASINSSVRVWFEKDGVRVSGRAAFTSEWNAIISFAPMFVVKAWSTEILDLYVELNDITFGTDYKFTSNNVDSTALNTNGSFTTPTLRTADYAVSIAEVKKASVGGTSTVTDNGMEIWAFSVENKLPAGVTETRDLKFKSITLRQDGDWTLSNLSKIVVERNGVVVSTNPVINGRDITFSINDVVKNATTATYYIKAIVNTVDKQAGDTYKFTIRNTSDVNVVESSTDFRASVTLNLLTDAISFDEYKVTWGDITFARNTNIPLASNYAAGTDNVVLMQGTLSTNAAVTVEDPEFNFTLNAGNLVDLFSTIYLQIGSSTFSYSPVAGWEAKVKFLGTATVTNAANVKMYAKLKDNANGGTIVKFDDFRLGTFSRVEYVSNGNTVNTAVGSIGGVTVTVEDTALNVTRIDGIGDTAIAKWASNYTVYKLNLSSNAGNGVRVSRATMNVGTQAEYFVPTVANAATYTITIWGVAKTFTSGPAATAKEIVEWLVAAITPTAGVTATEDDTRVVLSAATTMGIFTTTNTANLTKTNKLWNNTFLTLYVNGAAKSTKTVQGNTVIFEGFNELVNSSNSLTLEVKASMAEAFDEGVLSLQLNELNAVDALTSQSILSASYAKPAGAVLTIGTAEATLAVSNDAPKASLLLSPSVDNSIAALRISAKNDNVKLYNLKLTLPAADLVNINNIRLANASGEVFATASSVDNTAGIVLFTNISNAPSIAKDSSATFYVKADVNSNIENKQITVTVVNAGSNVRATNGTVVNFAAAPATIVAATHTITENTMVVAKAANPSKAIASSALRFTVTANWKNAVKLDALTVVLSQFGYVIWANPVVSADYKLYRGSVTTANEVTLGGVNASVDAGSTETFIVAFPGAIINSANPDWSVSVTAATFNSIAVGWFQNVGEFPMTEVK